jgi:uncharacterized protein (UPF0335 family)
VLKLDSATPYDAAGVYNNEICSRDVGYILDAVGYDLVLGSNYQAIKTGISKQKPALRTNPNIFIGKVQKLETATKNFLQQLKEVLGNEYDAKEVTDTTKAIHKLIEDLKKKYTKK